MKKKEIVEHIKNAVSDMTPDVLERVSSAYVVKSNEEELYMRSNDTPRKRRGFVFGGALATVVAVCLIILVGSTYFGQQNAIATKIMIDINPSIELNVNKSDKVVSVLALTSDAEAVLKGLELIDVDYNTAVHAIIGSVISNGFLKGENLTTLITVKNDDNAKAEDIRRSVTETISKALESDAVSATVFGQAPSFDEKVEVLAEQFKMSLSKAQLCQSLLDKNTDLKIEDLAKLSIDDLIKVAASAGLDLHDILYYSDDEYTPIIQENLLGFEKAEEIALKEAGGGVVTESELDYERSYWQYSITVLSDDFEYDFDIHAYTGAVIKEEKEPVEPGDDIISSDIISKEEAEALVRKELPKDAILVEWELDGNIYDFSFRVGVDAHEYRVDGITQQVVLEDIDKNEFLNSNKNEAQLHVTLAPNKPVVTSSPTPDQTITTTPIVTLKPEPTRAPSNTPLKTITRDEAVAIAKAEVGKSELVEVELDSGFYEVTLRVGYDKYEFRVNAATSSVTLDDIDYNEYLTDDDDLDDDIDSWHNDDDGWDDNDQDDDWNDDLDDNDDWNDDDLNDDWNDNGDDDDQDDD